MKKSVYLYNAILTIIFLNSNPYRERRKFAHKSLVQSPTSNFFPSVDFFLHIQNLYGPCGISISGGISQNVQFCEDPNELKACPP